MASARIRDTLGSHMLLMKVTNPQFLKRPWLFTIYSLIGGAWPIYFAGPKAQSIEVIGLLVAVVAIINLWFYLSLRKTIQDQEHSRSELN